MNKNHLILAMLCCFFLSCEKEQFSSTSSEPVFEANLEVIGGDPLSFTAGDENFYMFAGHQEFEDEIVYSGHFGKTQECEENCNESLAIQIHQMKTSTAVKIPEGSYDFYSTPIDGFEHTYSAVISSSGDEQATTTWNIDGEVHGGEEVLVQSTNIGQQPEEMKMIYNDPTQVFISCTRRILPKAFTCGLDVKVTRTNAGLLLRISADGPFESVFWSDGHVGSLRSIDPSQMTYSASISDVFGCTTQVFLQFQTFNIQQDIELRLVEESINFSAPSNPEFSANVSYTNADGEFFSSSFLGQIVPFKFMINEVEEFELNELGEPTWKITSSFDCVLFGQNGNSVRFKDADVTFAVSH